MGSQRTAWWAAVSPCLSTLVPSASLQSGPAFPEALGREDGCGLTLLSCLCSGAP